MSRPACARGLADWHPTAPKGRHGKSVVRAGLRRPWRCRSRHRWHRVDRALLGRQGGLPKTPTRGSRRPSPPATPIPSCLDPL